MSGMRISGEMTSDKDREDLLEALDILKGDIARATFIRCVDLDFSSGVVEVEPHNGYKQFAYDGRKTLSLTIDYQLPIEQPDDQPPPIGADW